MSEDRLTGMTPDDLRDLARVMGYADIVSVHCADRIARKFYDYQAKVKANPNAYPTH